MNFYGFYDPADETTDNVSLQAAMCLSECGYLVVPTKDKEPLQVFKDGVKNFTRLRKSPLHKYNLSHFFQDGCDIAILMGPRRGGTASEKIECVDVDCKADQHGYLWDCLSKAIEYCLPDVWDKLIIEKTKSDGRHIFYMCAQTTTKEVLAKRPGTADEIGAGIRERALIELIGGERMLVTISPTPGYHFIKGDPTELCCITIEERAELLAICRSFTEISSLDFPKLLSNYRRKDPEMPWNQFNNKHGYEYILQRVKAAGWEEYREHDDRVYMTKPGASREKTSAVLSKQDHFLYVFSTGADLPSDKRLSPFDIVKFYDYDDDFEICAKALADTGHYGVWHKDEGEFHNISENGKITASLARIETWLHDIGIRKFYPEKKSLVFELVQVIDNRVAFIDDSVLKKMFLERIKRTCDNKVYEYFLGQNSLFKDGSNLMATIDRLPDKFLKSSKNTAYIPFKNGIAKVTGNSIELVPHSENTKFIWESRILPRDYKDIDFIDCDVKRFLLRLSGEDPQVLDMYQTAIGYLIHPFKSRSFIKVPAFIDQSFNEDDEDETPRGRTGKGIIGQLLSQFKNVVIDDGKTFDPKQQFCWQRAKIDTEIYFIDDIEKSFQFEKLFSRLTDDFIIEKKYHDPIALKYEDSPKVVLTGNYGLRGSGDSYRDRQYQVEVYPYFSPDRKPADEFGYELIADWTEDEFSRFDCYFLYCIQQYIKSGFAKPKLSTLPIKTLIANTNRQFLQWMEGIADKWELWGKAEGIPMKAKSDMGTGLADDRFYKSRFLEKFLEMFPEYKDGKFRVTATRLARWIGKWAEFHAKDGLVFKSPHNADNIGYFWQFDVSAWNRVRIFTPDDKKTLNGSQNWKSDYREEPF